jgi:hypothetical protein
VGANRLDHRAFNGRAHQVDHLGRRLDTAQRRLANLVATGQHLEQDLIEVLERRRLNTFHGRHPQHDFVALAFGQLLEHIGRLVIVQVHQNGGDDLGVFVAQQFGHGQRVHPFQALNARDVAALQDPVNQQCCLVVAQSQFQHRAHIVPGIGDQQTLGSRHAGEFDHHVVDLLTGRLRGLAMLHRACTSLLTNA